MINYENRCCIRGRKEEEKEEEEVDGSKEFHWVKFEKREEVKGTESNR